MGLPIAVAIRNHIKTSTCRETLLTTMRMFGDKKGTLWCMYSSGLSFTCEAFNGHFRNKQRHCKLLRKLW